jgi:hypothetical protein
MLLPFEFHFVIAPGISTPFVLFALLAAYVGLCRPRCFDRVWMHPVFVAAYLFIGISAALEFANPLSSSEAVMRFPLMISGALLVASMCRDRAALKTFLYGYIGAAMLMGTFLILTSYGTLSGVKATDFNEASRARLETFADSPIQGNIATFALTCVQGGVVALAFALGSASVRGRSFFTVIGIFCLVASSLPMSRMTILDAIVSSGILLKAYGIRHLKVWLLAGLIAVSALFLVPDAIWSRMTVMTEKSSKESRVSFYESAIESVEDYIFMGVGAGNYRQKWGLEHGFGRKVPNSNRYHVYVVHNAFLQVLINWGVIGLVAFLAVIWQAYRCLPSVYGNDSLTMGILVIPVSLFLMMPFISEIHQKAFSLGLGMLVAYQCWLAPRNAVHGTRR